MDRCRSPLRENRKFAAVLLLGMRIKGLVLHQPAQLPSIIHERDLRGFELLQKLQTSFILCHKCLSLGHVSRDSGWTRVSWFAYPDSVSEPI